ncbi:MAG: EAL domain-containing protein, partial [Oscillospiraceae bacterium]
AEYDALTGIYNKAKFFEVTRAMLDANRDKRFVFARLDIEKFQLINSFYGVEEGDKLLRHLARQVVTGGAGLRNFTYGRMEADVFVFCLPNPGDKALMDGIAACRMHLADYPLDFDLVPTFGLYHIVDPDMPLQEMYDNACLAAKSCKGNYMQSYALYTGEMSENIIRDQRIVNNMKTALARHQFVVFLQPKYDLNNNRMAGAEALVRWRDPQRGMISPAEFISVFERNGFITQLDYYVWERVCQLLQKWRRAGQSPEPISVNISRVNFYNPRLVDNLCRLVRKYDVPPALLQLELTESAYVDSPKMIRETMLRFKKEGFSLLMDDFGSGYSSLNVLKDIPVDILKIDMSFLSQTEAVGRSENILASVVRMAKWLNMPVIAEGVEHQNQVDFLRSIGCEYVQGYYFAKPLPVHEYEKLIADHAPFHEEVEELDGFDINKLWISDSSIEAMFSNALQAGAVYEYSNRHLEVLRVNNVLYEMLGYDAVTMFQKDALAAVDSSYHTLLYDTFETAVRLRGTAACDYLRLSGGSSHTWIHLKLKYVNSVGDKHVLLGSLTDITTQKELDIELQKYRAALVQKEADGAQMLVVDDSEMNRVILQQIFADQYTVIQAESGERALEILAEPGRRIDIILLDLIMAGMGGMAFLNRKKSDAAIAGIPVVVITAEDNPRQQAQMLALGADDYIVRPFSPEIVVRRIHNVMESHRHFSYLVKAYHHALMLAQKDGLTQLYNRTSAETLITDLLEETGGDADTSAMIMLDIDDFKSINDTCGHDWGDRALVQVADILRDYFRTGDIAARFGGDEFCVFMAGIPSYQTAWKKCNRLAQEIFRITSEENQFPITCSMGIALVGENTSTFAQLYKCADTALYEAKRRGKNQCAIYGEAADAVPPFVRVSPQDSLLAALDIALFLIDAETDEMIYISPAGQRLCGVEDYGGKKCYEVIRTADKPCTDCIRSTLSHDCFFRRSLFSGCWSRPVLLRDKLINWKGRLVHLQLAVALEDVRDKKNGVAIEGKEE